MIKRPTMQLPTALVCAYFHRLNASRPVVYRPAAVPLWVRVAFWVPILTWLSILIWGHR